MQENGVDLLAPRRARVMIVNDDGPEAKGFKTLANSLSEIADVLVCIPFSAQIHPSFSITTNDTCTAIFREKDSIRTPDKCIQTWAVLRTPTDCVKFGLHYLCREKMGWDRPDIVVSGINHGANVGTELLYSGTVAAAFGARFETSVPAIAISQEIPEKLHPNDVDFSVAADVAVHLVQLVTQRGLPPNTIWNVNIPYKSRVHENGEIVCAVTKPALLVPKGSAVTIHPERHSQNKIEFSIPLRQYGSVSQPYGTDVAALKSQIISITPLHLQSDLHCPSKASLALKNSIKFHSTLKLDLDMSWDTEFPKQRQKIVQENLQFIVQFAKDSEVPMYTVIQRINDSLFQCEHYMGPELRSLLEKFSYREVGGFANLSRSDLSALIAEFEKLLATPSKPSEPDLWQVKSIASVLFGVVCGAGAMYIILKRVNNET